ncbi:uncharacterized protein EV154DRAFT_552107 [Mucor mucedo]|uniref:uncharacterized protein n=1 Tax=Mucor mucedo TaxID=29922 RepID=UPI00221E9AB0|nr:uncharacterized protein EV154DRAFT_552107 [Mucor mucedo]KAI7890699.1 hypothetical protein EV154DRAFT_552107 [Mucor mucedo]
MGTLTSIVNLFKFTTYNLCSCSVLHELKSKNYFIESEKKANYSSRLLYCKARNSHRTIYSYICSGTKHFLAVLGGEKYRNQLSNFTFVCGGEQVVINFMSLRNAVLVIRIYTYNGLSTTYRASIVRVVYTGSLFFRLRKCGVVTTMEPKSYKNGMDVLINV